MLINVNDKLGPLVRLIPHLHSPPCAGTLLASFFPPGPQKGSFVKGPSIKRFKALHTDFAFMRTSDSYSGPKRWAWAAEGLGGQAPPQPSAFSAGFGRKHRGKTIARG